MRRFITWLREEIRFRRMGPHDYLSGALMQVSDEALENAHAPIFDFATELGLLAWGATIHDLVFGIGLERRRRINEGAWTLDVDEETRQEEGRDDDTRNDR